MTLQWLHPFILARKYVKPPKIGSIWLGPAWRVDNSRSLWEVVETTPKATEKLGYELEPGWILVTPRNSGTVIERRKDEDGFYDVFLLWSHLLLKVIPWTTESESVKMQKGTLWVRPEYVPVSELVVDPNPPRDTQGKVTRVHEDVTEVKVGDRVVFTGYVGVEIELGGEGLLVLREDDVLAILEEV